MTKIEFYKFSLEERKTYIEKVLKEYPKEIEKLKILQLETESLNEYNKLTKNEINEKIEILTSLKPFVAGIFKSKTLRKKDYPRILKIQIQRYIEENKEHLEMMKKEKELNDKKLEEKEKRISGRNLLEILYKYEEFIEMEKTTPQREWDCLISIIEDGTITKKDLPDYGIDFLD